MNTAMRLRSGQALIEWCLSWPLLLAAALGAVQLALLAEAKLQTAIAVHHAVRSLTVFASQEAASQALARARDVAALSLSGVTPLPRPAFAAAEYSGTAWPTPPPDHTARLAAARRAIELRRERTIRGSRAEEDVLHLTYRYPLVIPLANRLFHHLCNSQAIPPIPTYNCPLESRGLTRYGMSRQ